MTVASLNELSPDAKRRVAEVMHNLKRAFAGDFHARQWIARESISTSDFPAIYQVITNAVIQKAITEVAPPLWPAFAQRVVQDSIRNSTYREGHLDFSTLPPEKAGQETIPGGLPAVAELDNYPVIGFGASSGTLGVSKVGARVDFSWEAFQGDDLSVIERFPTGLALAANRTVDLRVFRQIYQAAAAGFTTGVAAKALTANPVLSYASLGAAIAKAQLPPANVAGTTVNVNTISKWVLMVPPELAATAQQILSATNLRVTQGTTEMDTTNAVSGYISKVVVNPYMSLLTTGWTNAATHWLLLPDKGNGADRTTLAAAFLRGNETPELRIKDDTGRALGGGALSPYDGSFDNDSIQIRVKHWTGAKLLDTVGIVSSNGSGT